MSHIMQFFDRDYLGVWDLGGADRLVTIERVEAGTVRNATKKNRKPLLFVRGKKLPLALNKTNAKTIASLYGTDTRAWAGKQIVLYPTTTEFAGETVECIRVRPTVPNARTRAEGIESAQVDPEHRAAVMASHDRAAGRESESRDD